MTSAETVRAYDLDAAAYAAVTATVPDRVRTVPEDLARRLGDGACVLEVGSGGGRDALLMESLGLDVRRSDDLLDPLVDDLAALAEAVTASGWAGVDLRGGLVGSRGESWLVVSAVRDGVSA